jgi:hypothetical protein
VGTIWECPRCGRQWSLLRYSNGGHTDSWAPVSAARFGAQRVAAFDAARRRKRVGWTWVLVGVPVALVVAVVTWGAIYNQTHPFGY